MNNLVINLQGPICSGKTTIGRIIHERLPRSFLISLDKIKWLISDYTPGRDRELVSQMIFDMTKRALDADFCIIQDSNFMLKLSPELIERYKILFAENNVRLLQYNLDAPLPVLLDRLKDRVKRSEKDKKKISVKSEETYMRFYEEYLNIKKHELETFDTNEIDFNEIADKILDDARNSA
jgi:deoxyadenosine/deoxycytidine kinase